MLRGGVHIDPEGGAYASRKTWQQTTAEEKRNIEAGSRLQGDQEQALPARQGAGRTLIKLCLHRPEAQKARFPITVDSAHRSRRSRERSQLQPVHARTQTG